MGTNQIEGRTDHASIQVIIAAHAAFNARRLDELEILFHEDVDLFLPLALGLRADATTGLSALRGTLDNVLAVAPDLHMELERAEVVGDLVILACVASATGTDGRRYAWPLRVLVAEEHGRITRYVVRAPHADIHADAHAFSRGARKPD
ncbi:MAG: hypothetical protein JWM31_2132 [Solirubrobacterales bacterium]|nr:hypothetical protein [Solirubrobacterales bacterium]